MYSMGQGNLRGNQISFSPCVNAMERQPYWQSRMEVSIVLLELAQSFSVIFYALSLPCDSPSRDNHYAHLIKSTWERQLMLAWL